LISPPVTASPVTQNSLYDVFDLIGIVELFHEQAPNMFGNGNAAYFRHSLVDLEIAAIWRQAASPTGAVLYISCTSGGCS
jgi:hypothetical protein